MIFITWKSLRKKIQINENQNENLMKISKSKCQHKRHFPNKSHSQQHNNFSEKNCKPLEISNQGANPLLDWMRRLKTPDKLLKKLFRYWKRVFSTSMTVGICDTSNYHFSNIIHAIWLINLAFWHKIEHGGFTKSTKLHKMEFSKSK